MHSAIEIIANIFQIDIINFDIKPSYNVAPTQNMPIVVNDGTEQEQSLKQGNAWVAFTCK